jgi:hypothetical protein
MKKKGFSPRKFIDQVLSRLAKDAKSQNQTDDLIKGLSQLLQDSVTKPLTPDDVVTRLGDLYSELPRPRNSKLAVVTDPEGSCTVTLPDGTTRCRDGLTKSQCDAIPGDWSADSCAVVGGAAAAAAAPEARARKRRAQARK